MTYREAIRNAINILINYENSEAETVATLEKLDQRLAKRATISDEKKSEINARRKEENAKARAELMAVVLPILTEALIAAPDGMTSKQLYTATADKLPADFSEKKVQAVLIRELADKVDKIEAKGKANVYVWKNAD